MTHTSVFLEEAVRALGVKPGCKYIDGTYGLGGHSNKIAEQEGKVLAIDLDPHFANSDNSQVTVVQGNYAQIKEIAQSNGFIPVSGILFDLGLSMDQLSESERGFSYDKPHEQLDMRLSLSGLTAAEYLNETPQQILKDELIKYSEDINAPAIANRIINLRSKNKIEKVGDLTRIIDTCVKYDIREAKRTYARIFQAIRIIINNEIQNIQKGLAESYEILEKGGKIVVISFHSIEDRIVKKFGKENQNKMFEERIKVERTRKLEKFERSATLRVFTKK